MSGNSVTPQTVKVSIFGEEYSIRGYADPEYILRVADLVDKRMREVALKSKNRSPGKVAVLAALNLAGELVDAQTGTKSNLNQVEDRAKNILELLDSTLRHSQ
jgi:cell division protein ZapA